MTCCIRLSNDWFDDSRSQYDGVASQSTNHKAKRIALPGHVDEIRIQTLRSRRGGRRGSVDEIFLLLLSYVIRK